jgi:hypothetical protein
VAGFEVAGDTISPRTFSKSLCNSLGRPAIEQLAQCAPFTTKREQNHSTTAGFSPQIAGALTGRLRGREACAGLIGASEGSLVRLLPLGECIRKAISLPLN